MEFKIQVTTGLYPENQYQKPMNVDYFSGRPEMKCLNMEGIELFFQDLTKSIKVDNSINDWKLLVRVTIGGAMNENNIAITKRGITYSQTKEKEVFIAIPMPTNEIVNWGIAKKHRFNKFVKPTEKYNVLIPVDFNMYENMTDYLETNIRFGLEQLFKQGITLKKCKINI